MSITTTRSRSNTVAKPTKSFCPVLTIMVPKREHWKLDIVSGSVDVLFKLFKQYLEKKNEKVIQELEEQKAWLKEAQLEYTKAMSEAVSACSKTAWSI